MSLQQSSLESWRISTSTKALTKKRHNIEQTTIMEQQQAFKNSENDIGEKKTQISNTISVTASNTRNNQEDISIHDPPQLFQQKLCNPATDNKDKPWGHKITEKGDNIFRIGLQNINSLPLSAKHSKNELFTSEITNGQFDVYCATEVNIAWQNVPVEDKIQERFRGHFEFSNIITSNK
jgi:hypothetical protein